MAADPALLLLFDIDGTLLRRATREHAAAVRSAITEVHRIPEPYDGGFEPAGRTDGEIARLILLGHDVDAKTIDDRAHDVQIAACETFARTCPPDLSHTVIAGVTDVLAALAGRADMRLALVTGNFEPIARVKLRAAGIGHHFEPRQGGFGSDSEERAELPELARVRAGRRGEPHPRERTVVIGDTPRDIACARADGVHVLAVATGPYGAEELSGADGIAATTADLLPLLAALV